jgi:hypothetical protein
MQDRQQPAPSESESSKPPHYIHHAQDQRAFVLPDDCRSGQSGLLEGAVEITSPPPTQLLVRIRLIAGKHRPGNSTTVAPRQLIGEISLPSASQKVD